MNMAANNSQRKNHRTGLLLGGIVLLMFGFGFALVPLYNLLCQVTGIQSIALRSTPTTTEAKAGEVDQTRQVTVKFATSVNPNLPWEVNPSTRSMQVHPGQVYQIDFVANNRSSERVSGQAIPSLAPWQANPYFSKLECFCFNRQTLEGHQRTAMPLRFMVSPDLPAEINSLTLSYSLMRLKPGQTTAVEEQARPAIAANK
jgi:cytochrome c oxidase assembly protein subunit 11